jgi:hypothetical protein
VSSEEYLYVNVVFQLYIGRRRFIFQFFVECFVRELDLNSDSDEHCATRKANIKLKKVFFRVLVFS